MAVEMIRSFVTRLGEVKKEISILEEKLHQLKSVHSNFWESLQEECGKTFHDLTQEEYETYERDRAAMEQYNKKYKVPQKVLNKMTVSQYNLYKTFSKIKSDKPTVSRMYSYLSEGYRCPYCIDLVGGHGRGPLRSSGKPNIFFMGTFERWLVKDISDWPQEKKDTYEKAKKEVTEYFSEEGNIKLKLEELKKEENEICDQLLEIWSLCDIALGKDKERAMADARKEKIIRELSGVPSLDYVNYLD